ncbi:N-acetylmuramoyl-L-alanine amidase [Streptomyces sp. ScaeMP-e48]|uniref:N-acetylmuramoyl-L-alanine amidase n=1 Tax=Streptomyces sp. ScaeMP-e48 TaxID=1100823 RepID=UPI0008238467|nr:N-acetylmuramoyl-L-alanine amidase [Streptomyces sp. ScaeMP-e48]SCK20033.1 N-acetylmuramoyl-L-alanine amidase [Streptomyces sp. ScaeMP-e48]
MATPLSADRLLEALRAEGLKVVEHRNWRTNNRNHTGLWGPVHGVMIHHTVTSGTASSVELCYNGHSRLPGPLCHGVIDKAGIVHLVSSGRANHAGSGDGDVLQAVKEERASLSPDNEADTDGNRYFYGFECVNLGDGKDPWPLAQLLAIERAAAAICRAHGWSQRSVIGHLEWQPGKVDPRGFTMAAMRDRIGKRLDPAPDDKPTSPPPPAPAPPVKETDDMPKPITEVEAGGPDLKAGEWTLLRMAADSAIAQGPCQYTVAAYVVVTGKPGTRVTGRFHDLPLATKRPSLDLRQDGGVIGADGTLNAVFTRPGALDPNEQLKLEVLADADAKVSHRLVRGLRWAV